MNERSCVLRSVAYNKLKESYENKFEAVKKLTAGGQKTVWMLGDEVPEEIIIAGGFIPVRLWGCYGPRPNADKYLEVSFGALWRGLFENILNDEFSGLMDYLVLSNSSDIIQKLYYYLKQLKKIEPERKLPEIEYVDYWLVNQEFRTQERNWRETAEFVSRIEAWAGRKISDDDLSEAIKLCNDYKAALRDFTALRSGANNKVSGTEVQTIISGSFYMDKKEAIELIRAVTKDAETWPEVEGVKCFYTGSLQETTEVYGLMEESGLNIISDDKIIGDRYLDLDSDLSIPPVRAISSRYHQRFPSSERGLIKDRAASVPKRAVETGAEAVVIFMNKNDESYIWDLPRQRIELEKMGLKILTVENQYYPLRDSDKLLEKFGEFAELVKKERVNG